jgi:hypothetical protein
MSSSLVNTGRRLPPQPRGTDESPAHHAVAVTAYEAMANELVRAAGRPLAGLSALDADGGGAIASALTAAGARIVAHGPGDRAGGATLPPGDATVDVTAGDVLLGAHADSRTRLAEMARVTRPGGLVLAVAYTDHPEPAGAVVESVLAGFGYDRPGGTGDGRALNATVLGRSATAAGLTDVRVMDRCAVAKVAAHDVVDWRLSTPTVAPFVAGLSPTRREALRLAAWTALGAGKCLLQFPLLVMRAEKPA